MSSPFSGLSTFFNIRSQYIAKQFDCVPEILEKNFRHARHIIQQASWQWHQFRARILPELDPVRPQQYWQEGSAFWHRGRGPLVREAYMTDQPHRYLSLPDG